MDRINEAARYLGYKAKSDLSKIKPVIKECFAELSTITSKKTTFRTFNLVSNGHKKLEEVDVTLPGKSINSHLDRSNKVVLMAATLGINVDKKIKYYQYNDLMRSLVLDACASTLVEEVCDELEGQIEKHLGYDVSKTSRFSPGYGDLSLSFQNIMSKILNLEKTIGVTVNKSNILIPRKSVTAIIGIGFDKNISHCQYCNLNCQLKDE